MKKYFLGLLVITFSICTSAQTKRNPKHKKALVHTVYFYLKNKESQSAKDSLYQGILTLLDIKEIQEAYVGTPAGTRRDVIDYSYNYSTTFIFKNKAEQDTYQNHPIHLKFVKNYSHLWNRVQVYDAEGR